MCLLCFLIICLMSYLSLGFKSWEIPIPLNFTIVVSRLRTFIITCCFISAFLNATNSGTNSLILGPAPESVGLHPFDVSIFQLNVKDTIQQVANKSGIALLSLSYVIIFLFRNSVDNYVTFSVLKVCFFCFFIVNFFLHCIFDYFFIRQTIVFP